MSRISYAEVLRDAAEYCEEFAANEKLTWEGYRPARYEAPASTAAALRELARLVEQAERVHRGMVTNHDPALFDIVLELAAGFDPEGTQP